MPLIWVYLNICFAIYCLNPLGLFAIGRNRKSQLEDLVLKMKDHYRRFRTGNKIGALTGDMVRRQGKAPKLRAKGAETRHLVPFGVEIACAMHAANPTTHTLTVCKLASALLDFYMTLGIQPFPVKDAKSACRSTVSVVSMLHCMRKLLPVEKLLGL